MKRNPTPPDAVPPPEVQAWLDSLSPQEQQEFMRTWQWCALGQNDATGRAATQAARMRLRATMQQPDLRVAPARRPAAPRRLGVRKPVFWLGLFLIGTTILFYVWHGSGTGEQAAVSALPQTHFMLLLRDGGPLPATPAEEASRVAEYTAWAQELGKAGHLVGGDELADEGHLLQGAQDPTMTPLLGSSKTIGGYFIIAASNYAEAATIASACPQLRYGGTVELRPIIRR